MAKPQYISLTDHINNYTYFVIVPSSYGPVSYYDKMFNTVPTFKPYSDDMPARSIATINTMIDMHVNKIVFRLIYSKDAFDVYTKLEMYVKELDSKENKTQNEILYLRRAMSFLNECAGVCQRLDKEAGISSKIKQTGLMGLIQRHLDVFSRK